MFDKIKEIWKKRKVIGQVLKFVKNNQAWIGIITKAVKYAKHGYTRLEIAELINDVLKIFNLRANISYIDDEVTIQFHMRA